MNIQVPANVNVEFTPDGTIIVTSTVTLDAVVVAAREQGIPLHALLQGLADQASP